MSNACFSSVLRGLLAALWLVPVLAWGSPAADAVQLEALTSTELRERIAAGATTILVPLGGTEQNGPHMVLGKHNVRARVFAELIARELGNALVAPVMAYVPEGSVEPPVAHMRYAGTISIPEPAFEAVLEGAARSFRRHGFREVVFLGDHGGYQKSEERVAARLNREWAGGGTPCRVHALGEYYRASRQGHAELLAARGFKADEIGTHAGLADTALALAADEALVRPQWLGRASTPAERPGVSGDPRRATVALGRIGVERIVEASVSAIRERTRSR
ncbi:creatininase family protein [Rhizobacter sp. AJA081-3]|uniref:creatininase family protein n=1 Tax=Rhizobacter sp. AJA081-3 TaxID=2753607 RepID=UPI001AE01AEC|nr:creatininase family protein [Rhizobacter sp. AJA081-3]QTN25510.1 creatininase family protein [Rhizobacter sp. AJA081-3]